MKSVQMMKFFENKKITGKLEKIKGGKEWLMSIETDTGCYDLYDDGSLDGPPVAASGEK